ncbi:MAG: bifunctional 5,10-methylenetetrahydrofolate dehydrogenase/5,10-methenyltetrahydrofolate cyclohydrolase [Candidatus Aminicenantes bacterium]|nr:bifunctional 5,10-methylenetetrahydrofolate dehydrogenase/5,10-methenyltetrahydrofolate cyclohydrolase [Candidatus Aminicenantes bacterium]
MSVLDGKQVAEKIQGKLRVEIERLKTERAIVPGLTVILVGADPASLSYVNSKGRLAEKLGIHSTQVKLPEAALAPDVIQAIVAANDDPQVHAILVQMPLPKHLDSWKILDHIRPEKDVDCFHPFNQGLILQNRASLFPCTPAGILEILDHNEIDVSGMNSVVIGRSFLVGKPMATMLSNRNATVTLCHSKTVRLDEISQAADLVVAAIGRPGSITADMVKPGVVLIDVGINHIETEADFARLCQPSQYEGFKKKGYAITGDIHFQALAKASRYTPVPGGVGPLTVTMLMHNTVELCKRSLSVTRNEK